MIAEEWLLDKIEIDRYFNRSKFPTMARLDLHLQLQLNRNRLIVRSDNGEFEDIIPISDIASVVKSTNPKEPTFFKITLKDKALKNGTITFKFRELNNTIEAERLLQELLKEWQNYKDYTLLMQHEEEVINYIRETSPAYKYLDNKLTPKFTDRFRLITLLFAHHPKMTEYYHIAKTVGYDKERAIMLEKESKGQEKNDNMEEIEGYGDKKRMDGYRLNEEERKPIHVKSKKELEEEMLLEGYEVPAWDITDEFVNINIGGKGEPMQVEHPPLIQERVQYCQKVDLQLLSNKKYKITQPREIIFTNPKNDPKRDPTNDMDLRELEIVVLTSQIAYRLLRDPNSNEGELGYVEQELNHILNSEQFKLCKYVKQFVERTVANILQWKRNKFNI